ncbi:hypothetical protein ASD08_39060 [Streptomyces sp. Root369]|nr:hypothetical protein ASD08_39060 [Streptomyces sp. Root369]
MQPAPHPRLQRSRHTLRPAFQAGGSRQAGWAGRRIDRGLQDVGSGVRARLGIAPVCRRLCVFGGHALIF